MDRFEEYEALIGVTRTGSFTRAAEERGVTPSALSKQIKTLETRLGVRLLQRTTRRVSLTDAGRSFVERAEAIVGDVADAEAAVSDLDATPRGSLRVGAPMDFGRMHLASALAGFAALHPELRIEIELTDRAVDLVEEGLDVVVRVGELRESSLVARRLAPCHRVVCASPGYLDTHGRVDRVEDLGAYTRIGYAYEAERSWRFQTAEGEKRVSLPVRHRSNNGEVTRAMLVEGLGVALLPTFIAADAIRSGELEMVLGDQATSTIPIHAVYPHRKHLSAKVRAYVDFLAEQCGPRPYWDEGLTLASWAG